MKSEESTGYVLKSIAYTDMEKIRVARNEQIDVLRQKTPISEEEQKNYFEKVIQQEQGKQYPSMILFSLFKDDHWIGYGGLVHIDWEHKRAEVSFLVETKRAQDETIYKEDYSNYLELIIKYAFNHLKLHRLHTETYDFRESTIKILEEHGFKYEGRLKEHIFIKDVPHDSILHGLLASDIKI